MISTKHRTAEPTRVRARRLTWLVLCVTGCGDGARDEGGASSGFGSVGPGSGHTAGASDGTAPGDGSGASGPTGDNTADGSSDPSDSGGPGGGSEDGPGTDTNNPNTASATEAGPKFDLPPGGASVGDDGMLPEGACKIDFLFVVDDSCSMGNDADNIDISMPGFISTIETRFAEHDRHIMVVDTDDLAADEYFGCRPTCGLGLATTCKGLACTALPPPDPCMSKLGVGLKDNIAFFSCNFIGGNRYIIEGQPDLRGTFECARERGEAGLTDERPAGALLGAISPEMNAPGGCNAGFLRRDAILVITMITDEEDDPNDHVARKTMDTDANSLGDPASWRQAVVDAKNGDETAVVVLGVLGSPMAGSPVCPPLVDQDSEQSGVEGAEDAPRLRQFADSFTHGSWVGVCEANYAPFFDQAVSVIDTACKEFVPPPE